MTEATEGPARTLHPTGLFDLLGYRPASAKQRASCERILGMPHAPNIADASSGTSTRIAATAYKLLGVTKTGAVDLAAADKASSEEEAEDASSAEKSTGVALEKLIRDDLARQLGERAKDRGWSVECGRRAATYRQFSHLDRLQELFRDNPELRSTVGQDYQVQTDVCVGVPYGEDESEGQILHAAVSSKWTLRSDRAQNVRQEFATLVRNRRGRLPHLVLVTAEPLPTRLLSIARGTGEIDAVYHLLFDQVAVGVAESTKKQQQAWSELVTQGRLLPYRDLAKTLARS